jgi:pyrimidine-nucleoside phosphorylase
MLESGEQWDLASSVAGVVDKHSTGGVGDKVSLILSPLLAACGVPVAMLTGRSLGHTGGTADKLEAIPGLDLALDRARCVELLETVGMAIGIATPEIAPADRRLYALRDRTATVSSVPLVVGSILSKKLATGASGIVFDVKTGDGAIFSDPVVGTTLARLLVDTTRALGRAASAVLSDMAQPLGSWVGHSAEVNESLQILRGEGESRLRELTLELAAACAALSGAPVVRADLERVLSSGAGYECFLRWASAQGADRSWAARPELPLAEQETVLAAPRAGVLAAIRTAELGMLVQEAALAGSGSLDVGVALEVAVRLGDPVASGQALGRWYSRQADPQRAARALACFEIAEHGQAPPVVHKLIL